jgi:hypothetical protein
MQYRQLTDAINGSSQFARVQFETSHQRRSQTIRGSLSEIVRIGSNDAIGMGLQRLGHRHQRLLSLLVGTLTQTNSGTPNGCSQAQKIS